MPSLLGSVRIEAIPNPMNTKAPADGKKLIIINVVTDIIITDECQEPRRDEPGHDHPDQHRGPGAHRVAQTAACSDGS